MLLQVQGSERDARMRPDHNSSGSQDFRLRLRLSENSENRRPLLLKRSHGAVLKRLIMTRSPPALHEVFVVKERHA